MKINQISICKTQQLGYGYGVNGKLNSPKNMKLITAARYIELAAEKVGTLNRRDNLDSARIWLQGRSNNAWAEYAAGNSSLEQAKEADAALAEVKTLLAAAK